MNVQHSATNEWRPKVNIADGAEVSNSLPAHALQCYRRGLGMATART